MRFNRILIVDSIPTGERNTAQELKDELEVRRTYLADCPPLFLQRVETTNDLLNLISREAADCTITGNVPVLHIECHGGDDGLEMADRSFCTWAALKPRITELNVATRMNLLIVVSACDGSAITQTLGLIDRAPLCALIGPNRPVYPSELMTSYLALYETLFRTRSASIAVDAMRAATPNTFVFRTAEWVFQYVWNHYQANHETPEARLERGRHMAANPPPEYVGPPLNPAFLAAELARRNPEFFERFRRQFFICDLFPENEQRFNVDYEPPGAPPPV